MVDSHQRLLIVFSLKEKSSKKPAPVHQVFIRLSHAATGQELIFVVEEDSNNSFRLDLVSFKFTCPCDMLVVKNIFVA